MIRRTVITLVSVLALALTASMPAHAGSAPAPGPAPAVIANPTNVTANAKPEPVAKGKTITVTGTLKHKKNGQWRPLGAQLVTVHFDPAGSDRSRKVAMVRTTRTGSYTRTFTAARSGKWTAKYAGNRFNRADSAADAVCVYGSGRWQCPVSPTNPDLDCDDVRQRVWVGTNDYHRLDGNDNDGWGCESYS
ncbi:hypothetical protein [Promicromonospora iranensis]|uniref:Excalibur calcium-binding domain-containing protein n=1 Tax=Promicromonospora iranensis TaxID=1105144 RepID=A0ABU2CTH1_9MICO|nr:hypothetical protein [Promicromonospora iranensis]MDR7384654.1 hypothetical protein [Promicromonospora iranensis]